MQKVRLTARRGSGFLVSVGLVVDGSRKWLDPSTDGRLIAHDLLEHQNGIESIGTVHDELMALGGYWYVRGQFGQINSLIPSDDAITALASECARQVLLTTVNGLLSGASRIAQWHAVADAERESAGPWDAALMECTIRMAGMGFYGALDTLRERTHDVLHYLRRGARLASERFGDAAIANKQFWAIRDAIQSFVSPLRPHVGDEFELEYGGGIATCVQTVKAPTAETLPRMSIMIPGFDFATGAIDNYKYREQLAAIKVRELSKPREPKPVKFASYYTGKVYGPNHAQRNVYKEAR